MQSFNDLINCANPPDQIPIDTSFNGNYTYYNNRDGASRLVNPPDSTEMNFFGFIFNNGLQKYGGNVPTFDWSNLVVKNPPLDYKSLLILYGLTLIPILESTFLR